MPIVNKAYLYITVPLIKHPYIYILFFETKIDHLKVLFIAKNIPTPKVKANAIVLTIAEKISSFSKVQFLFPREWLPFGFQYFAKYRPIYKLKRWKNGNFSISVSTYPRLPFKKFAYWLWNKLSKEDDEFYGNIGPFDLIHAHYLLPDGYFAYLFSEKYNVPYVVTIRNADMRFLERTNKSNPDFKKALKIISNASKVLTLNVAYKDFIDSLFGVESMLIPHGIEETAFYEGDNEENDQLIISCVSTFDEKKNIGWVIDGVKSYAGNKNIKLNIIGSGKLEEKLKRRANDDRILFLGRVEREEVLKNLRKSDIFALPSSEESFGLVYLEAAASNNAIIGFEKEGVWGVFESEKEALYCKDKEHFIRLLHNLIDDPVVVSQLKSAAFLKSNEFTWPLIVNIYEAVYRNAISNFSKKM